MVTLLLFCSQLPIHHISVWTAAKVAYLNIWTSKWPGSTGFSLWHMHMNHRELPLAIPCQIVWHPPHSFWFYIVVVNEYECFSACMKCTTCVPEACGSQKRATVFLELKFQSVVWCPMWVWKLNLGPLQEQQSLVTVEPPLQPHSPKVFLIALKFTESYENHIYTSVN